jgi:glutamine amidotransferase
VLTVIDYGAGNIGSVLNMIRRVGGNAVASGQASDVLRAEKLLLPGVGSFDNAMQKLAQLDLIAPLRERALAGLPMLGICLGMQLLAEGSDEGVLPGLNLVPGRVRRFKFDGDCAQLKVPHMGWNRVRTAKQHALTLGIDDADARFYFVHSYHYDCANEADRLFQTRYGYEFTSGVQRDNVMGVQFHPEKSHRFGMQLIKNFIEL